MLKLAPKLEELSLANWGVRDSQGEIKALDLSEFSSLHSVYFQTMDMLFPKLPLSLEELSLVKCWLAPSLTEPEPGEIKLPTLKFLQLVSNDGSFLQCIGPLLLESKGGLEFLEVRGFGDDAFVYISTKSDEQWYRNLKELHVAYASIDDLFIDLLVKQTGNLEVVDFSHTRVTSLGIKQLVLSQPKLRLMNLLSCYEVNKDVVEWAEKRGIRGRLYFPDNKKQKYMKLRE